MSEQRYQVVLWDFDGTLCSSRRAMTESLLGAYEKVGIPQESPSDVTNFFDHMVGTGVELAAISQKLSQQAMLEEANREQFHEAYYSSYELYGSRYEELFPEVHETLSFLQKNGISQGLVSNKSTPLLLNSIERAGLSQYFSLTIGATKEFKKKPFPDIFKDIIQLKFSSVPLSSFLMIGDTPTDSIFAKNCGIDFALAAYGFFEDNSVTSSISGMSSTHTLASVADAIGVVGGAS
jgi:phosphoglycolate phosphatase